jgi:hypothetical protein
MTDLLPAPRLWPPWPRPRDVIRELAGLLRGHGVSGLHGPSCALPPPGGLTVWFGLGGELLSWHGDAAMTTWPAAEYRWRHRTPRRPAHQAERTLLPGDARASG